MICFIHKDKDELLSLTLFLLSLAFYSFVINFSFGHEDDNQYAAAGTTNYYQKYVVKA